MANKFNPIGGKPIGNMITTTYSGKSNKYYIPSTDSSDLWVNDFVKLIGNSDEYGIPLIAKADPGDKIVGVVDGIKNLQETNSFIYRRGGEERFVYVVDDPWVELEMQVNGEILNTDIGKHADIILGAGNAATGTSTTQIDLDTLSTDSAQIKIIGVVEKYGNEWGDFTHVRCFIAEHEYKDIPTYEENLWNRAGTTISPNTAGDDLDMGTGDVTAVDAHFTGKLTVDGIIDPTALILDAQAVAPGTDNGTIYYNSVSTNFQFRENGSWISLGDTSVWERAGTTISPETVGDDLDMGAGDVSGTDITATNDLYVTESVLSPKNITFTAQGAPLSTTDGSVYYDSGTNSFRFRENGVWIALGDTSLWDRTGTNLHPETVGDNLDMGAGDISATDAHFTGKLTVDGLIDPTALVLDGQGAAPGTDDGTIYYNSGSTNFQFRENGAWVSLGDTSVWERAGTTISPDNAGDDLDMGTGDVTATDAHFTGKLTVDGAIDPTMLVLDAQAVAPGTTDGSIYYDSVSTTFQFRENGAWLSLGDNSIWDRTGTTISPITAGDDLDMGTGTVTSTTGIFTGNVEIDGYIKNPTNLSFTAQGSAPATDDGTIYYDSGTTNFQFRENGAWVNIATGASPFQRAGTTISPANAGDDLDMGAGDVTATDAHFTGKLTVDGLIDPTALVLDAQGAAPGTDDGTIYYNSGSTNFQFRENGSWITLGDTSVWDRTGTTISPDTAGDDLDMGTGDVSATDAHFTGKLTVDGLIDPTALVLDAQAVAPGTDNGTIYYDSVSTNFQFRENGSWVTLSDTSIWDRTGTTISPDTAGDDLDIGSGDISATDAHFTGKLTVDGIIDPTALVLDAQGSPPGTDDGTIYYDSGSTNFQFRENGSWVNIATGASPFQRVGTTISPANAGDDLDMGTGDITATDAHFTGKLTVDGLIDPTALILDGQAVAPGTTDGTIYYDSVSTDFQFRENGSWVTLSDASVWDRTGTTISPDAAGDDLDMGTGDVSAVGGTFTGNISAVDAHFTGKLTVDGLIDPTALVLDAQGVAPGTDDGTIYYDSVSTNFQFRENGAWITLGDTSVWDRTGTTISPDTAGDDLDMGTGDVTATDGTFTGNISAVDAHFTGKLTVDGLIDPTALVLDAQAVAPGTDDGSIYYDSTSTNFQFRENGAWVTLGDTSVWDRTGTTISPDAAGDDLDMGAGDITATDAHFTGKLTVDGLIDPTALVLDAQGSPPGTDDGSIYYNSSSTNFQFRENGAWVTLGDTSVWDRAGTTISPDTAGDDLDMGAGDISAAAGTFTGNLTAPESILGPKIVVFTGQGAAPGTDDGSIYYDSGSTNFQFRENGAWVTLGDTSVWARVGTTISPGAPGDDLDMGTGNVSAAAGTFTGNVGAVDGVFSGNVSAVGGVFSGDISAVNANFTGKLTVAGEIDPTALLLDPQGSAPTATAGAIYYDSGSNRFLFREDASWVTLGDTSVWDRTGTTISPDAAGDDLDMGTGNISAVDGTFTGNISAAAATVTGNVGAASATFTGNVGAATATFTGNLTAQESILGPKIAAFTAQGVAPGTDDGSIYYNSVSTNFQFRENGAWVTLGDTSVWDRIGTTISPDTAGDDLDMGAGDITAVGGTFTGNVGAVDVTLTGNLTAPESILGPKITTFTGQGVAPGTTDGSIYYNSTSTNFQFRENGAWVTLGDTSVWDRTGTTISPDAAGDDLDMGTGNVSGAAAIFTGNVGAVDGVFTGDVSAIAGTFTGNVGAVDGVFTGDVDAVGGTFTGNISAVDAHFTGKLTVDGLIDPTALILDGQGSAPGTDDGTIYYNSSSTDFQFRENGAWVTLGDTSVWDRTGTTISPDAAGDDLDMGTGDITATDAHFTGKLTVDGLIDPTGLVLDAQGSAPGTTDGTVYYDSVATKFQFRENGAWATLNETSAWAPDYFSGFVANRAAVDLQHDMEIDRGSARGINDLSNMKIASGSTLVKRIDANWVAGTNQGGFPSGLSLAANTWYHLFVIGKADGTTDAGFDTSLTATNLLADATGYVDYRRITSVKTDGSSHILSHNQKIIGGVRRTLWDMSAVVTGEIDRNGAGQTTDTVTLNVPIDVYVKAFGEIAYTASEPDDEASIFNVDQTALFGGRSQMMFVTDSPGINGNSTYFEVYTNTSAQAKIFQMGSAVSAVRYTSRGWEE